MKGLTLTEGTLTALLCMQKYRFLSIRQFVRLTGNRYDHAAETLREMENRRILGYFGYTSIPGHGRTPKIYFLTKRGFTWLVNESSLSAAEIGTFHDVHHEFAWSTDVSPLAALGLFHRS